jgi:hypothetical protein
LVASREKTSMPGYGACDGWDSVARIPVSARSARVGGEHARIGGEHARVGGEHARVGGEHRRGACAGRRGDRCQRSRRVSVAISYDSYDSYAQKCGCLFSRNRPGVSNCLGSVIESHDVGNPASTHSQHLPPFLFVGLFCCRMIAGHRETDEDPVREHDRLRYPGSDSRLPPAPIPGKDLILVLAGRRRIAGRTPMHIGVEQVTQSRQVGRLNGHPDLPGKTLHGFQLIGHRRTSKRRRQGSECSPPARVASALSWWTRAPPGP